MILWLNDYFMLGVQALALAMARIVGCGFFLPLMGKRHMSALHRNSLCFALSMSQALLIWNEIRAESHPLFYLALLALKEVFIGCALGFLLSISFWGLSGAFTLLDNQRGANAAQQSNPSLSADASIFGDLSERAFIIFLIHIGTFNMFVNVIADSYQLWPLLSITPNFDELARHELMNAIGLLMHDTIIYCGPILLILLLIEFAMAINSTAVQGVDVYQTAMPIKSLSSIFLVAIYMETLLKFAENRLEVWWLNGILKLS